MYLKGLYGTEFELVIEGYEHPEATSEPLEADWLSVVIGVNHPLGNWTATAPMLLTWEAGDLADWLLAIADERARHPFIEFTNVSLELEMTERTPTGFALRVFFEQDSRPPWDPSHFGSTTAPVSVEVRATAEELRQAAADLREQAEEFPVRVGRP